MAELNARIIAKASGTASEEPLAADLEVAELAVNTADGKLFTKHTDGSVVTISGGGGGATELNDLTDVNTAPALLVNFTSFDSGEPTFTDPRAGATAGSIDSTLGTNAYKNLATVAYGDGSKLSNFLATDGRYDVVNLRIRSTQAIDTNNRISLGGNKQALGGGGGFALYTRDTGFGFYVDSAFSEIGTRPTMNADTWYEITWVADWGSAQRSSLPAISLWVDGAIAINNVTPTANYTELSGAEANNFRLGNSTTNQSNQGDKFWDDIRVVTSDTLPWGMTDTTITNPAGLMDSTYIDAGASDGEALVWDSTLGEWRPALLVDSVNGQTGTASLGIQDMNDYGLVPSVAPTYDYSAATSATPASGVASRWGAANSIWAISTVGNDGTDWESSYYNEAVFANGNAVSVYVNGSLVSNTSASGIGNRNSSRITFSLSDSSWYSALNDGDEIRFEWAGFPSPGTPLADGDVLRWLAGPSEFRPTQLGINDLADVDISTVAPTDGQALVWDNAAGKWEPGTVSGSGGGAVDSVNGETGVVSLGIQDMDDYSLNTSSSTTILRYDNFSDGGSFGAAGYAGAYLAGNDRFIGNNIDSNGVDATALQGDAITANGGTDVNLPVWFSADGINWTAAISASSNYPTDFRFNLIKRASDNTSLDLISAITASGPIYLALQDPLVTTVPLADGDILKWVDADQEFRPAQPRARIQDMDDYGLNSGAATYTFTGQNNQASGAGIPDQNSEWRAVNPPSEDSYFQFYRDGGADFVADFDALQVGDSVTWTFDSTTEFTSTVTEATGGTANLIRIADDFPAIFDTATLCEVTSSVFSGVPVALADGDILQWNDGAQEFRPVQLPSGGGGGAVDSVNGETGVVSLGIQDMDDYGQYSAPGPVWATECGGCSYPAAGEWSYQVTRIRLDATDSNGTNHLTALQGLSVGSTVWVSQDGVSWTETTLSDYTEFGGAYPTLFRLGFTAIADPAAYWPTAAHISFEDPATALVPLADGDILTWVAGSSEFRPTSVPVASVNSETGAVSLGIEDMNDYSPRRAANTLRWDDYNFGGGNNDFYWASGNTTAVFGKVCSDGFDAWAEMQRLQVGDVVQATTGADEPTSYPMTVATVATETDYDTGSITFTSGYPGAGVSAANGPVMLSSPRFLSGNIAGDYLTPNDGDIMVWSAELLKYTPGRDYISLTDLKAEVAASTDFADFQSRIAAL